MDRPAVRYLAVIALAFAATFLLQPVLHELGHALAALLLGGRVVSFSLWPPYVDTLLDPARPAACVIVSYAGLLFPLLASLCLPGRPWPVGIVRLALRTAGLAGGAGGLLSALDILWGRALPDSDVSVLAATAGVGTDVIVVLSAELFLLAAGLFAACDPAGTVCAALPRQKKR